MVKQDSGKAVIIVVLAALALVCSIGGVAVFVRLEPGSGKPASGTEHTTLISVGELVVNLADTNQVRYLKTDLVLEVTGAVGESEEKDVRTRVRDTLISVLSSKRFVDLVKPDGKTRLKKQILAAVNNRLKDSKAVDVYFNEFAMQ